MALTRISDQSIVRAIGAMSIDFAWALGWHGIWGYLPLVFNFGHHGHRGCTSECLYGRRIWAALECVVARTDVKIIDVITSLSVQSKSIFPKLSCEHSLNVILL